MKQSGSWQRKFRLSALLLWHLALVATVTSCAPVTRGEPGGLPTAELFLPSTPRPSSPPETATAQPAAQAAATQQDPAAGCQNSLTFLADVTIPDGTIVTPSSTMDKRWQVENSGNCNWGKDYRLRLIAGSEMGAQTEQALYPARSGTRAVLRIVFIAPQESGVYRSAWQAFNPRGEPFGDPFFIEVTVQ